MHLRHLDGLRGIAILLVLVSHLSTGTFLAPYLKLGWTGVDLFFVLSGFLITGILLDTKNKEGYYRIFITRRVLRIFPIYYAVLLICLILSTQLSILSWFPNYQLYFWTYTQNFLIASKGWITVPLGHFWSLAIEEQFYLLWPLIILSLKPKQVLVLCALLLITALSIRWYNPVFPFAQVFTLAHIDGLLIGSALAIAVRLNQNRIFQYSGLIMVLASILFAVLLITTKPWREYSTTFIRFGFTLIAFFYGALLLFSLKNEILKKILSLRPLVFFGIYSYGIYVYHGVLINMARYYYNEWLSSNRFLGHSMVLLLSLGISYISYNWFEKFFLSKKPPYPNQIKK